MAERGNRTNLEIVCAMLHNSGLPKFLWAEAISHAIYLWNRTWTCAIREGTPFKLFKKNGSKPNLAGLHPWGCKVQVHDITGSENWMVIPRLVDGLVLIQKPRMAIAFIGPKNKQYL